MELANRETEIGSDGVRLVPLQIHAQKNRCLARAAPMTVRRILRIHRAQRGVYAPADYAKRVIVTPAGESVAGERIAPQPARVPEVA